MRTTTDARARVWAGANVLMLVMFVFSAVVQFNDPDPLPWIAVYTAAAVLCLLEVRWRSPVWAPLALAALTLAWSAVLALRAWDVPIRSLFAEWEMRDLHVEEAREMYGLAFVGAWMLVIVGVRWTRLRRMNGSGAGVLAGTISGRSRLP